MAIYLSNRINVRQTVNRVLFVANGNENHGVQENYTPLDKWKRKYPGHIPYAEEKQEHTTAKYTTEVVT